MKQEMVQVKGFYTCIRFSECSYLCDGKNNQMKGFNVFNIGTGDKTSVLKLISTFEEQNNVKIPYQITERRDGDVAICYADPTEAKKELGWKSKYNLAEMCKDSWDAVKNGAN